MGRLGDKIQSSERSEKMERERNNPEVVNNCFAIYFLEHYDQGFTYYIFTRTTYSDFILYQTFLPYLVHKSPPPIHNYTPSPHALSWYYAYFLQSTATCEERTQWNFVQFNGFNHGIRNKVYEECANSQFWSGIDFLFRNMDFYSVARSRPHGQINWLSESNLWRLGLPPFF